MEYKSGYSRDKRVINAHIATIDEVRQFSSYYHAKILDGNGNWREVKITLIKTWKRKADVEIHWKYGLYDYGITTYHANGNITGNQFLVEE